MRPSPYIAVVALVLLSGHGLAQGPDRSDNGLKIRILKAGKGPAVQPGDEIEIHEETSLLDGTIVYSSYKAGKAIRFCQGGGIVIQGVDMAVLGMKVGEVREAIIPPKLSRRRYYPGTITPEDTLKYKLELVRITGRDCNKLSEGEASSE